jgi:flagellar hook-basal body complex protein FliE
VSGIEAIPGISPVAPATRTHGAASVQPAEKAGKPGEFGQALDGALEEVDGLQKKADKTVLGLSTGEVEDVHQVMIAMNEADLAFRMMLEIRNRIVDAYKEISRLQM